MLKRILKSTLQRSTGKKDDLAEQHNICESAEKKTYNIKTVITEPEKETIIPSPIIEKKEISPVSEHKEDTIPHKTSEEKIEEKQKDHHNTEKKLLEHCFTAEKLIPSTNWEPANNTLSDILSEWPNLDKGNNYPELKDRFNEAYSRFKKRYDNHSNIKLLIASREQLCNEIEELAEHANTDSAANRIHEIQDVWIKSEKIPPRFFEILEKRYNKLIYEFHESAKTLNSKAKAEAEVEAEKKAKEHSKIIEKDKAPKSNLTPEKEKELAATIEELCIQLKQYTSTKDTRSALSNVNEIQERWENIENGRVKNSYSVEFRKLFRDYFSQLKFIQQKEDWARWENYTNKHLLCEQIENLLNEKDLYKVSKKTKILWENWRKIGPAPKEKNDIIWERFISTRKELNNRCKDFFNNRQQEKIKNLEAKIKLCEDVEKIKDLNDWEHTANELKTIQKTWKEIGRAPQPQNDELYERLRTACNYFFEKRSSFYAKLHERQAVHKNRKKELCAQAEELLKLPYHNTFKRIKELRNQWNDSPPASRRDEQALWSRFNNAIESFIKKIEEERPINFKKKEELYQTVLTFSSTIKSNTDINKLNSSIDEITTQWKQIGPGPKEEDLELNTKYDKTLKELKLLLHDKQIEANIEYRKILHKKECLIAQLEVLATSGEDCFTKNTDKIKEIQSKWVKMDSNASSEEELLEKRFTESCDAFNNGQKEYFNDVIKNRQDNLNAKRKLCIQLEHLAGISLSKDVIQSQKSNTLADEIKFSIENNFAANDNIAEKDIYSKYQKIQNKWKNIGPIPVEYYEKIYSRYDQACNSLKMKK